MTTSDVTAVEGELDLRLFPRFYGDRLTCVQHTIDWVHEAVRKTIWSPERLRDRLMLRTPAEILADGDTFVMGPCVDRTGIAALLLSHHEIPYTVVAHERVIYGYGPPTMHLAVELEAEEGDYWFDFRWWETRFLKGKYEFNRLIEETIEINRFRSRDFDPFSLDIAQAMAAASPRRFDRSAKIEWYCSQLDVVRPEMLREQLVYDPRHSRYGDHRPPSLIPQRA
jgi:hypothetical protein